jgi:hypothetical protein
MKIPYSAVDRRPAKAGKFLALKYAGSTLPDKLNP